MNCDFHRSAIFMKRVSLGGSRVYRTVEKTMAFEKLDSSCEKKKKSLKIDTSLIYFECQRVFLTFKLLSVRIGGIRTFCLHPRHIELCLAEFGVQSKCSCFSKLENNRSKDHGTETSLDVIIRASLSIESKSCHGVCFA